MATEVRLQQQVRLRVRRVQRELVDFDWKLLRQLSVDLVFVVTNGQVGVLVSALKYIDSIKKKPSQLKGI